MWLRKPADFTFLSENLSTQEYAFAKKETEHALFGFIYSLDCFWISHPLALRGAMWKAEQLIRAKSMGFIIPDSIISNSPQHVKAFQKKIEGNLVFKTMSTPFLAAEEVDDSQRISNGVPTTIITDEMANHLDAVSELPCHFQAYIEKLYELRVTVIGNRVFAAKINSQDDDKTMVDSRDMSAEITYQAIEIPSHVQQACLAFVASYGLNYSALDIIVTPEHEYVFLENNPNGQFLYIEQLIPEYKMLEAIADTLVEEIPCQVQ